MTPKIPLPTDDELSEDARAILARLPPLNVFRMVASLPESLRPFLQLGGSLLTDTRITASTREIAILRVAHATNAPYEWAQHVQLARNLGVGRPRSRRCGATTRARCSMRRGALVCRVADEISRDVRLSDEGLQLALDHFGQQGAATLILCVSYYNMVSRFLESTRVEIEPSEVLAAETPATFTARRRA